MSILLFDLPFRIFVLVIAGILGAVFGSFLDCQADRIIHKQDWIHGRSHCDACGHELALIDLIPVFSWLFAKGRCRYCHEKIPKDCLFNELFMMVVFLTVVLRYGISGESLRYLGLVCALDALSLIDWKTYEIPDGYHIFLLIWWAATIPLCAEDALVQLQIGLIGAGLIGGGMLVLTLVFEKLSKKEAMGGGDLKLFFLTGLYLGAPVGLFNIILACIIGLLFVVILKAHRIPFGPSISLATYISILFGSSVVSWYLSLF